jgi:Tol biopolymer transport system component
VVTSIRTRLWRQRAYANRRLRQAGSHAAISRSPHHFALIAGCAAILSVFAAPAAAQTSTPAERIVYIGSDGVNTDVFTMAPDGTDVHQLTADGRSYDPALSPDATRVVYTGRAEFNTGNIYVTDAEGGGPVALTSERPFEGTNFQPTWAPDGRQVLFVSTRDEGGYEIERVDADGTNRDRITSTEAEVDDWYPDASPRGDIVFSSDRANTAHQAFDLFVRRAEGGVDRLTFDSEPDENGFVHDALDAQWSPDGTRIAFDSTRSGNREVWVMDADGTDLQNVSDHAGQDYAPSWSPDGSEIVFTSSRSGTLDLWAAPAPTSDASAQLRTAAAQGASAPRNLTDEFHQPSQAPDWERQPPCTVSGTPQPETLKGTGGPDVICAKGGDDSISSFGGADLVLGGRGDDTVAGARGADELLGGSGRDTFDGGEGADLLHGGAGRDQFDGSHGSDLCLAAAGELVVFCSP